MKTILAVLFLPLSAVSFAEVSDLNPQPQLGAIQADVGGDICQSEQGKSSNSSNKVQSSKGSAVKSAL